MGSAKVSSGGDVADQADTRPKRGHGEGNIYKRADGVFVGRIMLGRKPNGRPDRPKVTGTTRVAVLKQIAELRRQADEGTLPDPAQGRQTVAAYLEAWLDAAGTTARPQTLVGYRQIVRDHITPTIGRYKLSALRPDAIQRLYAKKLAEGLSAYTVRKIHIVLHRALELAVRWRYIPRNPADDVDPPTATKRDARPPEPAELTRLVEAAELAQDRLTALWALAIYTGCRQGELLALGWTDVDMDRATLTVRRNLIHVGNQQPQFGAPKSETSRRTISLPTVAVTALRAHKARQAEDRLAAKHWADYELVFCSAIGTPLLRRNVNRSFSTALKRAGLPATIRFHDLRHAHATLMLRAGVPLKVASGRLGHGSVAITADLYQHWATDMDIDAAERAASAMSVNRSAN